VSSDDECGDGGIGSGGVGQFPGDSNWDWIPGILKALVNLTIRAQRSIYEPGIELADPVLNTPSATEGQNNHTVGGVYSNEASDAAYSSTILNRMG
jgi:hypothetical protein